MANRKAFGFLILAAVITVCTFMIGLNLSYRITDWNFGHVRAVTQRKGLQSLQGTPRFLDHATNGIHMMMVFPLMQSDASKRQGYNISNVARLKRREKEFTDTLKKNSNRRIVTKIYLLNERPEVLRKQLTKDPDLDMRMIETIQSNDNPSYMEVFQFASTNLQNKLVFILNADNSLGRGFDQLNLSWWERGPKIMYALTRHTPLEGCKLGPVGYCDSNSTYLRSHDGFMFYINKPLPHAFLKQLDFPSNFYGSENVIIWAFKEILKFNVSNPCRRLYIHHNHCSGLRPRHFKRSWVNRNGRGGTANFTY